MTAQTAEISAELPCHGCGYDLRAHPPDGKCPECGASVAEARRLAAIPRRPAWRDSDPRWRRRMLAGAWVLALLPLMDVLMAYDWAWSLPLPTVFDFRGPITLSDTFLCNMRVYEWVGFCIGVVLLFSKERGRRRSRWDWTRRWGVICSYVVFLLSVAPVFFITALVLAGIAALFLGMPAKYQPEVTQLFVDLSTVWLRYGPYPKDISYVVLTAFSSIAMLLASVPLLDALRSSGPRRVARILLVPLALFALMHMVQVGLYCAGMSKVLSAELFAYGIYFSPQLLVDHMAGRQTFQYAEGTPLGAFLVEAAKWAIVLAIAVWLSIAQLTARRRFKKVDVPG